MPTCQAGTLTDAMPEPDVIDFGGEILIVIQRTDEELVFDATWQAGTPAPPPHLHPRQDEHFEVLEGEITVVIDKATSVISAGETLDIPRGTTHRMWNPSNQPARARWTVTPALRTEELFRELAALGGRRASPVAAAAVLMRHRDEIRLALPGPAEPVAVNALGSIGRLLGH